MMMELRLMVAAMILAASAALAADAQPPVIVVLGDSLVAGFGLQQDQAFPAQLQAALRAKGENVTLVNAGVSGDTSADGLDRLDWALPDNASGVILEFGANDALQGLPPEATEKTLATMIEKIKARGLPILLAGMEAPRNMGKDYVEAFDAIYPDLAKRYDLILYPFFLEGVAVDPSLTLDDRMHPNPEGVAAIVRNIMPKVEELIARISAKQ